MIVHGGGCLVDSLMKKLQLPVVKKQGLRVTPPPIKLTLLLARWQEVPIKTLLSWATRFWFKWCRTLFGRWQLAKVTKISDELGHVGNAEPGSPELLNLLLNAGYLPIISSIGVSIQGELMNVNADQAATAIAETLGADLVLLSDVSGILDGKGQNSQKYLPQKRKH